MGEKEHLLKLNDSWSELCRRIYNKSIANFQFDQTMNKIFSIQINFNLIIINLYH